MGMSLILSLLKNSGYMKRRSSLKKSLERSKPKITLTCRDSLSKSQKTFNLKIGKQSSLNQIRIAVFMAD